jgi:hypothetical protein
LNLFILNRFNGSIGTKMHKAAHPSGQAAWIHQIHTAGGASSSITMVMVFVCCLCFFVPSRLIVVTRHM